MTTKDQALVKKRPSRNAKLRAAAGIAYIGSAKGISVADLHQNPKYSHLSMSTLEKWCGKDKWVEQRQALIDRWTHEARKRLGTAMAQERLQELDQLREIKDIGIAKIKDDLTVPKSLEGVMKATIDVIRLQDELREKIGEDIITSTSTGALGLPANETPVGYAMDELDAAAKAALAIRRAKMRSALQPQQIPATTAVIEVKPVGPVPELMAEVVEEDDEFDEDGEVIDEEPEFERL